MSDTLTMSWPDERGDVTREVNQIIDVRDFVGKPGYAWLVMAANPHLSAPDIELAIVLAGVEQCERSASWIRRRRWLFHPKTTDQPGRRANADGKDGRALAIMAANPKVKLPALVRLLKEHGITRSREWCRLHRCDDVG